MNLLSGRNTPAFRKDTVYRFMKMTQINWIRFTTVLSSRIIKDAIVPLDSEDRANVLIVDDSMSVPLSSENKKNRINEASEMDKRSVGYKRR